MKIETHNVTLSEGCTLAPNATLIGTVSLGKDCSVFPGAVLRGDAFPITVGDRTNIQDNVTIHTSLDGGTEIGSDVSIGHGAIVHGCTVADAVLIGMGATVMNYAQVGEGSIVGAGALVPEGMNIPPRSVVVGVPARIIRSVTEQEVQEQYASAARYAETGKAWADGGVFLRGEDVPADHPTILLKG